MSIERTFSILKPDATARNVTGAINAMIEKAGLRIVAQKRMRMSRVEAETFYAVHRARPFFGELNPGQNFIAGDIVREPGEVFARGVLGLLVLAQLLLDHGLQVEGALDASDEAGDLLQVFVGDVERQMQLTHKQRRQLDSAEAKLWARQNRLEGFLIHTRGSAWWHARRNRARTETVAADSLRRG